MLKIYTQKSKKMQHKPLMLERPSVKIFRFLAVTKKPFGWGGDV